MIVTVTANPSIDRTLYLDAFVHRGVNRVRQVLDEPSGKGVNVALALHRAGTPACAVLPIGGATGDELNRLLTATGVPSGRCRWPGRCAPTCPWSRPTARRPRSTSRARR